MPRDEHPGRVETSVSKSDCAVLIASLAPGWKGLHCLRHCPSVLRQHY